MSDDGRTPAEPPAGSRGRPTRGRILQAALDLFARKGVEDTTVAEIAEKADVRRGTFFSHFPTKESVFADVMARAVDAMERRLDEAIAAGEPPEARVLAFFQPAIEWHTSHPLLSRALLAAFLRDPAFAQADRRNQRRLHERLTRELAEAQAAGHVTKTADVAAAASDIETTYFGSLGAWHVAGRTTALADDFARSLRIVFRGLRP